VVYYKKTIILKIYDSNKRCVPYIPVPTYHFDNKKPSKKDNKTINIGTFSTVIMFTMINIMKARVDTDKSLKDLGYAMVSNLLEMKNNYFISNNKNMYDNTIFKEFVIDCKGKPVTPEHERQIMIEYRRKHNKKFIFSYDPSDNKGYEKGEWKFFNSSGNPIKEPKNLKLTSNSDGELVDEENIDE